MKGKLFDIQRGSFVDGPRLTIFSKLSQRTLSFIAHPEAASHFRAANGCCSPNSPPSCYANVRLPAYIPRAIPRERCRGAISKPCLNIPICFCMISSASLPSFISGISESQTNALLIIICGFSQSEQMSSCVYR